MSIVLLPCPFCGSARISHDNYIRDGREVHCRDCGAATHAFMPDANLKAIAKWNKRPETVPANSVMQTLTSTVLAPAIKRGADL